MCLSPVHMSCQQKLLSNFSPVEVRHDFMKLIINNISEKNSGPTSLGKTTSSIPPDFKLQWRGLRSYSL